MSAPCLQERLCCVRHLRCACAVACLPQEEQDKRHRWCQENIRRRHNYVPLLFNMLRLFAERGQLTPLVEHARTLAKEKKAQPGGQ